MGFFHLSLVFFPFSQIFELRMDTKTFHSHVTCIFLSQVRIKKRLYEVQFIAISYVLGTVNSKSFVSKVMLRIKWKFELTVYSKHGILGKL